VPKTRPSPLFYPLILVLICLFIAFKNYTPGTFLTGWDTLHPEFNFSKNFSDLIFGVWRSDQGLGAVAGHSHMADLPRVIILWLFHFILPLSFLRYSYIFLCLIIGPLGFYFLIKHLFNQASFVYHLSFIGALVYLLNLGTLQQFFVPFEMFPTQWAFLPLIILFSLKYLQKPTTLKLLTLGLLTLLSTPQAYAAQLWYAFFSVYFVFLLFYGFLYKNTFRLSFHLLILTLFINSFWLLPNLYYAITQSDNPRLNLTNRLHSQEFLLKNRQTGTLADTSLLKGFYFNWDAYNFPRKTSNPLMPLWLDHLQNYDVRLIGELLFLFSIIGLISVLVSKNRHLLPLTPFFVIPFILLANRLPFFSFIFDLLVKIPLIEEISRFIFTKFSILLTFGYSLFFTVFIFLLFSTFAKLKKPLTIAIIICLSAYCYPFFTGNLISPIVRIVIPDNYFQLNKYLSSKAPARILSLPLHNPEGWQYYDWGYQGSGFLWFGFPEALLDRDSDRWAYQNEEAYREFKTALYSNNHQNFLNTLQKYRIGYILWDLSVIPNSSKNRDQITYKSEISQLLTELNISGYLKEPQIFGSLQLFSTNTGGDLVELKQINNFVGPSFRWHYSDPQNSTDYLTTNSPNDSFFPFRKILNNNNKIDPDVLRQLVDINQSTTIFSTPTIFSAINNTQGTNIPLESLLHNSGYIIGIKSKYFSGIPLRLCFKNLTTSLCAVEDETSKNPDSRWDYFLIPPQDNFLGYNLELNLISYGFQKSQSQLDAVSILPIDYWGLSQISTTPYNPRKSSSTPVSYQPIFPNNSLIKISLPSHPSDSYLLLNQSFSKDWLAFYFVKNKIVFLNNHLLLNNWANGWSIENLENKTIYILFWPQLLEFLGFFLLVFLAAFIIISPSHVFHSKNRHPLL
jgi:hypothetical protein